LLVFTAVNISEKDAERYGKKCYAIDNANVLAAEIRDDDNFEGCPFTPTYSIALKPVEDMVIPLFVCSIHFNAFRISLREGNIGVDDQMF